MATDPTIEAGAGGGETRATTGSSPSVAPEQRAQASAATPPGVASPVGALATGGSGARSRPLSGGEVESSGTGARPLSGGEAESSGARARPLSVDEASAPVQAAGADMVARLLAGRPFYISHRMGGSEYPEFTRRGLDASLRAGFTALEVSVRRCASGEFVAIHDWTTARTVRGTNYQIWKTPWSTLRTLRQGAGPFMRLTDIVASIPDTAAEDRARAVSRAGGTAGEGGGEVTGMNIARVLLALVLLALAWVLGALIDAWVPAAAAIAGPTLLAERLLYVAWKERQA